jgi:glycosyltransferase involved in cell wall biosynthesis
VRVTYDDQIFVSQRRGGISRYFSELIDQFSTREDFGVEPLLDFRFTANEHLLGVPGTGVRSSPLPARLDKARLLRQVNRYTSRRRPAEILHHTYYMRDALSRSTPRRVCTVYDMIPELFPENFPQGNPHQAKRAVVDACDAVICISDTTRRDLVRIYGPIDKPVIVTPLAVGADFHLASRPPPPRPQVRPYVLFVGQRGTYKNFTVLARAFRDIAHEFPRLDLLCVGGGPFTADEAAGLGELLVSGRVRQTHVPDAALPNIYRDARCFVFPSRYEGFGLPALEAMAAGCPVIVADNDCLAEVVADAAVRFDADDFEALAELLRVAADDGPWSTALREKGRSRARAFTWEATALATAEVYRRVL